ncbi:hypothetical protein NM208_g1720 [Fusarium decemcellulare]|uniref:Uncharacterized protein n=1 Tax=Fusarium decemcellulare TaxID=57161 RepID=A0ACC1SUW5_9HYPO|nr:hypothetical protein NM208_g1720 [Fusarium decemcellulare]
MALLYLLVIGILATCVVADFEDDISAYVAIFFYFGYLHEWGARDGLSTIGGPNCRGSTRCNFNSFLDATTNSKGGYNGGVALDVTGRASSKILADRLKSAGLTKKIDWNPQRLINGASSDKKVLEDHVSYVLNAASQDKGQLGAFQPYLDTALDALSNMAEINAGVASHVHVRWWRANGLPSSTELNFVTMPVQGDSGESEVRSVIDTVNLVKTWGYDIGKDLMKVPVWTGGYEGFPNPHLGRRWAATRLAFQMCRTGRAYPPGSDAIPPFVPPWN